MRDKLEFEMYVQRPVDIVMARVAKDAEQVGIKEDDFNRAVLNWISEKINQGDEVPDWLLDNLKPE